MSYATAAATTIPISHLAELFTVVVPQSYSSCPTLRLPRRPAFVGTLFSLLTIAAIPKLGLSVALLDSASDPDAATDC